VWASVGAAAAAVAQVFGSGDVLVVDMTDRVVADRDVDLGHAEMSRLVRRVQRRRRQGTRVLGPVGTAAGGTAGGVVDAGVYGGCGHQQTLGWVGHELVGVDVDLVELLEAAAAVGAPVARSCAGVPYGPGCRVWLEFSSLFEVVAVMLATGQYSGASVLSDVVVAGRGRAAVTVELPEAGPGPSGVLWSVRVERDGRVSVWFDPADVPEVVTNLLAVSATR
jgi:hypothetical protein